MSGAQRLDTVIISDFDTLAKLNAIITDATLDDASSPRTPTAHTHLEVDITDLQVYLLATDIDTLAELNLILTDATLDDASSPRTPTAHTHLEADITDLQAYLLAASINTLAKLNAIVGDATLIDTGDSRLSDARTPTAHTHLEADITDLQAYLLPTDIGVSVQAFDAGLVSIAGLTTAADKMIFTTAADVYATTDLTGYARTLLDDVDAAAARATLILATMSQAEAEAGTATITRAITAQRLAQAIAALESGGTALDNNFVFAYDTTTQAIGVASTYQGLDFSNNGEINGWTHVVDTSIFGCTQTGKYLVTVDINNEKSTGGSEDFGMRALFDSVEVPGSMGGRGQTANNVTKNLNRTFLVDATTGQDLEIQVASTSTDVSVVPAPDPGGATTDVSASITITRIT